MNAKIIDTWFIRQENTTAFIRVDMVNRLFEVVDRFGSVQLFYLNDEFENSLISMLEELQEATCGCPFCGL